MSKTSNQPRWNAMWKSFLVINVINNNEALGKIVCGNN